MKIRRREKNAVELIDALQNRIRELESSSDINAATDVESNMINVLNDPEFRPDIDDIEYYAEEIEGRGYEKDDSNILANSYKRLVEKIYDSTGMLYDPLNWYDTENPDFSESRYSWVATKDVMDSDGFRTDYSLYQDLETGEYFTVFGDRDLYGPNDAWHDADFDSYDEAMEWFDSYNGFEDEE